MLHTHTLAFIATVAVVVVVDKFQRFIYYPFSRLIRRRIETERF